MTDIKTGPDFAFPMEDAPKDGSILRLLVKFDRKSAAGAFEDTTEPSWTIGTNNKANTGEDQWDIVGWSWEQDVFCHAYGAKAIGWLPFHTESNEPTALPPPSSAPAESGAVAYPRVDGKIAPPVEIGYTNYRGEFAVRCIMPLSFWYGSTDWHPEPQWLVKAYDADKGAERDFAFKDFGPAPSASMGRVTVKALEWGERKTNTAGDWTWGTKTSIGWYIVSTASGERCKGSHFWFIVGETISAWANSEDEAKAAAQADYEARILAALDSPPDHGGGEGWVLVPREPTMAMMAAGADRVDDSVAHANAVYRAMLASLPTQESEDGR